jgi:cell division inhibitor SepF
LGLISDLKRLTKPYDDDEEEFEGFQPKKQEEMPVVPRTPAQARSSYGGFEERREGGNKVVNIHATAQLQVALFQPEKFELAAEIADKLRERCTVVLNLEKTNKDVARRLVDFLSGVAYAQDGKIKKVAVNTYLITPYNVNLLGDLIDELENTGVYFN